MLAYYFVRLIETHSDALASKLLNKVQQSGSTRAYNGVPLNELKQRVYEIYEHLGDWVLGKKDVDIQRRYREIGARRYHQQVPLSELIWAIVLTKQNLWEFLTLESIVDGPVRVFGELEALQLLSQFFDRAIYYAAMGYEEAREADQVTESSTVERDKKL